MSIMMTGSIMSQIPTEGLVGFYPFNGNAEDCSGNNNDGSIFGPTISEDRWGNCNRAFQFDGNNDYILLPTNFDIMPRTVSFWFNADTILEILGDIYVSDHRGLSYGLISVEVISIGGIPKLKTSIADRRDTVDITASSWHHVVIMLNDGIIGSYLDNVKIDSAEVGEYSHSVNGLQNTVIGSSRTALNRYFRGKIDDIRIYNRELSEEEIASLYYEGLCFQTITVTDTLIINTNLTGFNPVTYQNTIKIYPNPTNDKIFINYGNYESLEGYHLRVTNSLGQEMFFDQVDHQESVINLSEWSGAGLYLVYLINVQNTIVDVRKIVLQ
jgi:hypothetical protein